MHRSAVTFAAIVYHYGDDVGLVYYCNVFVSLFSVSGLLSFKERIFQGTPLSRIFQNGKQYLRT